MEGDSGNLSLLSWHSTELQNWIEAAIFSYLGAKRRRRRRLGEAAWSRSSQEEKLVGWIDVEDEREEKGIETMIERKR